MTDTTATLPATGSPDGNSGLKKVQFTAPASTWLWALGFLLSLSLAGLSFYPALVFATIILLNRFYKNRYDFLIMVAVFATSPGFIPSDVLGFNPLDPLLALSCLGLFFYRKNLMVKKVTLCVFAYIMFLVVMSTFSDETFAIQILTLRQYASIILFILPLWLFANRDFDANALFSRIIVYLLWICLFYAIDGFVFSGWVLLPGTFSNHETFSTFWDIHWQPFSTYFPRKYPSAMFIVILSAYPLARHYRLKWWQWAVIAIAFAATRTMTVIGAFVITYVTFQGRFKQFAKYCVMAAIGVTALYFVDTSTGGFMRIASTIDQLTAVNNAGDSDDLAEFGTGRMGQILPKYEALVDQNCLAQGFGFIHPTKTTLPRYQIYNEYYSDISLADENAAYVEVTQFNAILHTGLIGLVVQTLFYIYMYFLLKPGKLAQFYLSALLMASIMGVGGFAGLTQFDGLMFVAVALGAALLDARPRRRLVQSDL